MAVQHDFKKSLTRSQADALKPMWRTIYMGYFPDFEDMSVPVTDLDWQRKGVDRVVHLQGGVKVFIDEKLRPETWTDVFLEKWSSIEDKTPGWVNKSLHCDFIAYAFEDSKNCFMLPFQQLRRVWVLHGPEWEQRYGTKWVKNYRRDGSTYNTVGVPVPIGVLMQAIRDFAICINWEMPDDIPY